MFHPCPIPCVYPTPFESWVSHSVGCPAPYVSHSVCVPLRVYLLLSICHTPCTMCFSISVCLNPCLSHSVCVRLLVCPTPYLPLTILSTPCGSHSVCISHSVFCPLHVVPTPCVSPTQYLFHSMCFPLRVCLTPSVSHSFCVPLRVCPAPCMSYFVCVLLHVCPTPCMSHFLCSYLSSCLSHFMYIPLLCSYPTSEVRRKLIRTSGKLTTRWSLIFAFKSHQVTVIFHLAR